MMQMYLTGRIDLERLETLPILALEAFAGIKFVMRVNGMDVSCDTHEEAIDFIKTVIQARAGATP